MESTITSETTVAVADDLASTTVEGEAVVLSIESGTYYGLNGVGREVWELLDETATVGELERRLVETYDVGPDRCREDLVPFLADLAAEGLVTVGDGSTR